MPFVMRMHRRCCTFAILLALCVFAFLQVYLFRQGKEPKTVIVTNPESKKHWFRLKINNHVPDVKKPKNDRPKTILLWTKFFGEVNFVPPLKDLNCPKPYCMVTSNRSYLLQSDAIIFHVRDMSLADMPSVKLPFQRWILLHHESPPHTPDILKYLDGHFNWTATYRLDSDIQLTPTFKKRKRTRSMPDYAKNKSRMVAWFVSSCYTNSNREGFVKELQKSIPVDIYGACGTKQCLPKMSVDCYKKVAAEYRYYLSFENSICKDYVTEKFFHILDTDMVPVVFGGANYSLVAPPTSYIDAFSFQTPRELAHFLLAVAKDPKKYNNFFLWKTEYEVTYEHYACQICRKLHENPPPSYIENLHEWWFGDAKCRTWNPNYYIL